MGKSRDCDLCKHRVYRRRLRCSTCERKLCFDCAVRKAGEPTLCRDCYLRKREAEISREFDTKAGGQPERLLNTNTPGDHMAPHAGRSADLSRCDRRVCVDQH